MKKVRDVKDFRLWWAIPQIPGFILFIIVAIAIPILPVLGIRFSSPTAPIGLLIIEAWSIAGIIANFPRKNGWGVKCSESKKNKETKNC